VVPSGTLIDVLWDERPPPTAPKILQNGVSHLRKQLGDGRLETRIRGRCGSRTWRKWSFAPLKPTYIKPDMEVSA
jgi:hypothetical protein